MARLQKKHSSKDKKKKQEKDSSRSTSEGKIAKVAASSAKSVPSSSKKSDSIKGSTSDQSDKKNIFKQGIEYLQEVQSELKKVTWPTRKQTMGTTLVVIVLVAIVSVFLGLFDFGFSKLIQAVLA
ncbi:MAG: preprotein translocase subunit SecE [Desulfobacteraceae bacterium]|nr:preprotein translocase subunit SecE [Desulfobacteraceae bacterium]